MNADTERRFAAQIAQLANARIPPENILIHFLRLNQCDDLLKEITDTTRDNHCGTIIVERESYGWLCELISRVGFLIDYQVHGAIQGCSRYLEQLVFTPDQLHPVIEG